MTRCFLAVMAPLIVALVVVAVMIQGSDAAALLDLQLSPETRLKPSETSLLPEKLDSIYSRDAPFGVGRSPLSHFNTYRSHRMRKSNLGLRGGKGHMDFRPLQHALPNEETPSFNIRMKKQYHEPVFQLPSYYHLRDFFNENN